MTAPFLYVPLWPDRGNTDCPGCGRLVRYDRMQSVLVSIADPDLGKQVERLLSRLQVDMFVARSAAVAEVRLLKGGYDVVIADLPGAIVGGQGELKLLQLTKGLWPKAETVLIAAGGSTATMVKAQEVGVSYYFEAPMPEELLTETLLSLGIVRRNEP